MEYAIKITNLSKTFRDRNKVVHALRNVSLTVRKGEIFGLLGPNGSGKTTMINTIVTLIKPEKGRIEILGINPEKDRSILQRINYVATGGRAQWRQTPLDILVTYARLYNVKNRKSIIDELVKRLGISHFKKRRWINMSTGEQARVRVAKGLVNTPEVLLLDEPTLGLDPISSNELRKELKKINRQKKMTIFLTSHNMKEISELADRVGFIKDGRLVHVGSASAAKRKHGNLERYWMRLGE